MKPFTAELNDLIRASGKSATKVAEMGRVDRAYLHRLLTGEKTNPSADTLVRIWIGVIFDEKLLAEQPDLIFGLERLILSATWNAASQKLLSGAGVVSS